MLSRNKTTPFWPVQLLALGLIVAVLAREPHADQDSNDSGSDSAASDNVEAEGDAPDDGSRSVAGVELNGLVDWIVPLFSAQTCSDMDGYLCGIGVIIRRSYMLASNKAMLEISDSLNKSGSTRGPPGVFMFYPPDDIDISKYNEKYWQYGPKHVKTLDHGIGIWRASIRPEVSGGADKIPPPRTVMPLEKQKGRVQTPCKVISYGHQIDGDEGLTKPIRRLNILYVEKVSCKDNLCLMRPSRREEDHGKTGALCGFFSELGAPVVCGKGIERRVQYIVAEMGNYSSRGCSRKFKALEVAEYADGIEKDVNNWVDSGQDLADSIGPSPIRPG